MKKFSAVLVLLCIVSALFRPSASAAGLWPFGKEKEPAFVPTIITGARLEDMELALDVHAPGISTNSSDKAVIDFSNVNDGYVMVQFTQPSEKKLKAQVTGPGTTYTYTLRPQQWAAFPLSDGDGEYKVSVFEEVGDSRYALVLSAGFEVCLTDQFAPFLRPNQYVNYAVAPNTVATAEVITSDCADTLAKVGRIYEFVVGYMTYDKELAASVQSGYLPDLDLDLQTGTGICFDYASMMTGMLRSLGVPCKLVVGYAGDAYHAWISVWVDGTGWIDNIVYFDGTSWQRMDPTFASTADKKTAAKYIGDGSNYSPKFFY